MAQRIVCRAPAIVCEHPLRESDETILWPQIEKKNESIVQDPVDNSAYVFSKGRLPGTGLTVKS